MERFHNTLADGVELVMTRTNQFKTGVFSVTLTVPLRADTATAYALIPDVLYRGSRNHPNMESLSAATDELYGASLGPAVRQRGESQCVGFHRHHSEKRRTKPSPLKAGKIEVMLKVYAVGGAVTR